MCSGEGMECSDVFQAKASSHSVSDSCLFCHDITNSFISHSRLPMATTCSMVGQSSAPVQNYSLTAGK